MRKFEVLFTVPVEVPDGETRALHIALEKAIEKVSWREGHPSPDASVSILEKIERVDVYRPSSRNGAGEVVGWERVS